MGNFVKHRVRKKSVKSDVLPLIFGDEFVGNGPHDLVELGAHGVLEL